MRKLECAVNLLLSTVRLNPGLQMSECRVITLRTANNQPHEFDRLVLTQTRYALHLEGVLFFCTDFSPVANHAVDEDLTF